MRLCFIVQLTMPVESVGLTLVRGISITVGQVFAKVAEKYDLMNDAMSGGIHRLWKDRLVRSMAPVPGTRLLDVAGGTGDIAMRFLDYCASIHGDKTAEVVCIDINPRMLEVGKERFEKTPYIKCKAFFCLFLVNILLFFR